MSLFLVGMAGAAVLLYLAQKNAPTSPENPINQGDSAGSDDQPRVLRQYADMDDQWSNPHNLTTDTNFVRVVKEEVGPNGVPRKIIEGPGGCEIITYGDNYSVL